MAETEFELISKVKQGDRHSMEVIYQTHVEAASGWHIRSLMIGPLPRMRCRKRLFKHSGPSGHSRMGWLLNHGFLGS